MKTKQNNTYQVIDSMGRNTSIYYSAQNINESIRLFKNDKENYRKHYHGKIIRCYNGGVRG